LAVKAPTGHKSIIFPDISDFKFSFKKVKILELLPLPIMPNSSVPAISEQKLTHLLHKIHLVTSVETNGPKS